MTASPSRTRRIVLASVAVAAVFASIALLVPEEEPGVETAEVLSSSGASERPHRSNGGRHIASGPLRGGPGAPGNVDKPETAEQNAAGCALEIVVTSRGAPLSGAAVGLHARGLMDPNTNEIAWTAAAAGTTGEDGVARVRAAPGEYLLQAEQSGLAPAHQLLRIAWGELSKRVEITLEAGHPLSGRTVASGGRGEPVPLAQLTLVPVPSDGTGWGPASAPASARVETTSDPRGEFALGNVAKGAFELQATAVGFATAKKRIEVPSAPITIELKASGIIEGFVVYADGRPAEAAEVSAIGGEQQPPISGTGPGGGFSLEVPPGTYRITAKLGELAGSQQAPVAVAPGQTVRDVRVTLGASATLEGSVLASGDGAPVAGAQIAVSPFREAGDLGRARSDEQGAFRIAGLAPGSYDLVVWADGYGESMQRAITALAGQTVKVEVVLAATGTLEGTVTDGRGAPIAGAQIRAGGGSEALARPALEARTDATGGYRLGPIDAGRARVMARVGEDGPWQMQAVVVDEGTVTRADFRLDAAAVLSGHVRTQGGGRPGKPVLVRVVPQVAGKGSYAQTESTTDGAYRLEAHAARYRVYAMDAESRTWAARPVDVELQPGETRALDLLLEEEEAGLSGRVVEPDGSPSPNAWITAATGGATLAWARCDEEGRFSMPALKPAPGTGVVLRARNGGRVGELELTRPDGSGAVVRLRRGAVLEGRILAKDGEPPESFRARARLTDGPDYSPELQFFGDRFRLDDVPSGKVRLTVRTDDGRGGVLDLSLSPGEQRRVELAVDREGREKAHQRIVH